MDASNASCEEENTKKTPLTIRREDKELGSLGTDFLSDLIFETGKQAKSSSPAGRHLSAVGVGRST